MRLAIFDVDGTLVDSQGHIVAAMQAAFAAVGLTMPPRAEVLGGVGLSLDLLMARLGGAEHAAALSAAYRTAYQAQREAKGAAQTAPLYSGTLKMLTRLAARGDLLLAVATGKSRRGLDAVLEAYEIGWMFTSRQTADTHPSKPHPSMIQTILAETGLAPERAVMIGDTQFDMEMGRAAGVATIGVPWGYHRPEDLGADRLIGDWAEIDGAIEALTGGPYV